MPELPEIHTVVAGLQKNIVDKKIIDVSIEDAVILKKIDETSFKKGLLNKKIVDVERRGKYIIIHLDSGKKLIIHLRMTGQVLYFDKEKENNKYVRINIRLADGTDFRIGSKRKFTTVNLVNKPEEIKCIKDMGPEPLSENFDQDDFKALFKKRNGMIKPLLMNQRFLAGLGNIYADEALYLAGIHPETKANKLTDKDKEKLFSSIRKVLRDGIKHNGTSRQDYVNTSGESGNHQDYLMVYGQHGKKCQKCDNTIKKIKVSGRGTHYCPKCQVQTKS